MWFPLGGYRAHCSLWFPLVLYLVLVVQSSPSSITSLIRSSSTALCHSSSIFFAISSSFFGLAKTAFINRSANAPYFVIISSDSTCAMTHSRTKVFAHLVGEYG